MSSIRHKGQTCSSALSGHECIWMMGMGTALLSVSIQFSAISLLSESVCPQSIVMSRPLLADTAIAVKWWPHPSQWDWALSCVSKATRRWKWYKWNNSPPLLWRIWSLAPSTTWGFTPMSSTASAANLSPLRPKQVSPHLARWNQGSSLVGWSGYRSVTGSINSSSVKAGWVRMTCFPYLVSFVTASQFQEVVLYSLLLYYFSWVIFMSSFCHFWEKFKVPILGQWNLMVAHMKRKCLFMCEWRFWTLYI